MICDKLSARGLNLSGTSQRRESLWVSIMNEDILTLGIWGAVQYMSHGTGLLGSELKGEQSITFCFCSIQASQCQKHNLAAIAYFQDSV